MEMEKLIGKRVLFRLNVSGRASEVRDEVVKEVSPSGRCVRMGDSWCFVEQVDVIEEMPGSIPEPIRVKVLEPTPVKPPTMPKR